MEKFISKLELQVICDKKITYGKLCSPKNVYEKFKWIASLPQEEIWGIYLSAKNEIIGYRMIYRGTVTNIPCNPADIIKPALLCNACAIILIHNHPSGYPDPSEDDIRFTEKIKEACKIFQIELLDHVVLGNKGFVSIKEKEEVFNDA